MLQEFEDRDPRNSRDFLRVLDGEDPRRIGGGCSWAWLVALALAALNLAQAAWRCFSLFHR
jgi:hypothetical protein